ncbi:MAG: bifunctional 5,10-methylenetetrahydrofolate dehydrogenase/5,10-methenyltetrahydrofolate cyclohydrolase [Lachnospiraceae bacterium]|jgi:methylenetetrahydrofolate dehydrogenase (NADP+)/methenyltetrahydrofolate cyclohydrolase|nr:bifunctional 5,10-methylenetetrahydrofolate dehydrogenase/5,10-methenyltetrahydrofolate cyclohydrolase [Lachnospiraceae bacterium]
MTQLLKGAPVAAALREKTEKQVQDLKEAGVIPTLAILRVGERPDDISYENGACRRAEAAGVAALTFTLSQNAPQQELADTIMMVNEDPRIHGVLLLRPLPKYMDEERLVNLLSPRKDVDGITDGSLTGVFTGKRTGFAPCTAQACMEILDYYGISCGGKKAVVTGRSLVVGRPLAMLLLHRNATVTLCHSRTQDLAGQMREGDIVIAAAGQRQMFGREYLNEGQTVLDVGIHFDDEGRMCGDVVMEEAMDRVAALTPVPGGVGAVTTAVLISHVAEAARRSLDR